MSNRQTLALALLAGNGAILAKTYDAVATMRGLAEGATMVLLFASFGVAAAFGAVAAAGYADDAKPFSVRLYHTALLAGTLSFMCMLVIGVIVAPSLAYARG